MLGDLDLARVHGPGDQQSRCLNQGQHTSDVGLVPDMVELAGDVRRRGVAAHDTRHTQVLRRERQSRGRLGLGPPFPVLLCSPESERTFLALEILGLHAPGEVWRPHHPGKGLQPHDRADALGLGRSQHHVRRARLVDPSEDRPLRPDGIQHPSQVAHAGLEIRQPDVAAGKPRAPPVVENHPARAREGAQKRTGDRPLPGEIDIPGEVERPGQIDRPLPGDLIRDVHAIWRLRVPGIKDFHQLESELALPARGDSHTSGSAPAPPVADIP